MISLDPSLLSSYYQARNGTALANSGGGVAASAKPKYAPTAPWATNSGATRADGLVKIALAGRSLINENATQLDLTGASADYKKLFTLYQGLNSLYGLAEKAGGKGVPALDMARLQKVFDRGLNEVAGYADSLKLEQVRLARGEAMLSNKSTIGVPKNKYEYITDKLHTGAATDEIPAFAGAAAFDVQIKKMGVTKNVAIDLTDMGATPRTIPNVVNYINGKLQAEGVNTRFSVERTKGAPRQIPTTGGKFITLPAVGDDFAIKVKGDSSEQVTFAAAARTAVYVTTRAGNPDPDKDIKTDDGVYENKLLKIDPAGATAPETRIKTETLEGTIGAIHASQTAADGSIYMLADVEKSIDGQAVKGERDVALLKYDSAGNMIYARTLGAEDATGLSLAVSADGKVAVAGAVTGQLQGAVNGPINSGATSGKTDSFVTLYDAKGDESWTMRRGALDNDEATAVAFGADGTVYVAGRTKSSIPGATVVGGWDSYVSAYATNDKGLPKALFTQQFGTTADDKPTGLVVDGNKVTVAGTEDGRGVLRSFDVALTTTKITKATVNNILTVTTETYLDGALTGTVANNYPNPGVPDGSSSTTHTSGATATAGATRDLGSLEGGAIAGLRLEGGKLWIAGQTRNAALTVSGETRAHAGGMDAFAASLSTDLSSTADDNLAYYGGAGDNTVAGMTVSGGKIWLVGAAGADLPGLTASGTKEGYIASLDVATGAVSGAQRISGKDGFATATSIAVSSTGASDLDRFGLPTGTLAYESSQKVTSSTSARAGDQFQIRTRAGGAASTITIEANDTLTTLAAKIRRAGGYNTKVEVVSDGDNRVLKITPANANATVEIMPGKGGKDALDALGLTEGVIRQTKFVDGKARTTAPGGEIYGLGLKTDIDLSDTAAAKKAMEILGLALGKIRTVYRDLETAAKPKSATTPDVSGPVPAYLQAQIANYTAGLNRLNGG